MKLLIGLAMPGLALAAFCMWTLRRQQGSFLGNDTAMARELKGASEEMKSIARSRCGDSGVPKILDLNFSDDSSLRRNEEDNSPLPREISDADDVLNTRESLAVQQEELHEKTTSSENYSLLESGNRTLIEDPTNRNPVGIPNSNDRGLLARSSGNSVENSSFLKDSSVQKDACTTASSSDINADKSERANNKSNSEGACAKNLSEATELKSTNTKAQADRAQSFDEFSDVSSGDSKAESPLDLTDSDPALPEEGETAEEVTWEIEFPQALCGRLIGKKGKNVQKISQVTGAKIRLIPQNENTESSQRLVALTGSPQQLKLALKGLRKKFPSVPFTRLNGAQPFAVESHRTPGIICVALPQHELCQVFVTNIVDANHFYVQLYDHAINAHLRQLDQQMYQCYAGVSSTEALQVVNTGMLCAASSPSGWWWRAQVVGLLMNPDEVEISWLDYGGRTTVAISMLRQLRYVKGYVG